MYIFDTCCYEFNRGSKCLKCLGRRMFCCKNSAKIICKVKEGNFSSNRLIIY